jgi:hypothetical protein
VLKSRDGPEKLGSAGSGTRGSSLSAARYLTAWRRRHGLSDAAAAEWCCLSVSAFRRQRRGGVRDSGCQQTIRLAELYAIHNTGWLDIAETAMKVGRLLERQARYRRAGASSDQPLR